MSKIKDALLRAEEKYGEEFYEAREKGDYDTLASMVYGDIYLDKDNFKNGVVDQRIRDVAYDYIDEECGETDDEAVRLNVKDRIAEEYLSGGGRGKNLTEEEANRIIDKLEDKIDEVLDDYDYRGEWEDNCKRAEEEHREIREGLSGKY